MRSILDEATDPWGIKVNRVELKNIVPPKDIQNAMEKQMRAERERREQILQAEGQKQSQILVAQGEKESMILRADGEKAGPHHGGRSRSCCYSPGERGHGRLLETPQ